MPRQVIGEETCIGVETSAGRVAGDDLERLAAVEIRNRLAARRREAKRMRGSQGERQAR
jgi:hypothetical protein